MFHACRSPTLPTLRREDGAARPGGADRAAIDSLGLSPISTRLLESAFSSRRGMIS